MVNYLLGEFLAETMGELVISAEEEEFFSVGHLVVYFFEEWEGGLKLMHFFDGYLIVVALNLFRISDY